MDKVVSRRRSWRPVRVIATLLVTVVTALGTVLASTTTAEAAAACSLVVGKTYPGGPGHPSKVHAGVWRCGSHEGFCVDFGDGVSNSTSLKGISKVPGLSAAKSRAVMFISNTYSSTKDPSKGADAGFAVWWIINDRDFRTWFPWAQKHGYVSQAQVERIKNIIDKAMQDQTRKLSLKLEAVYVSQTGDGSVTVVNSKGDPVAGAKPKVTLSSNAKFVTKPGATNAKGIATFSYKVINVGPVKGEARLSGPSSTKAYLTRSSAGHQRILVGGVKATYKATAQFEKRLGYEIDTVCDTDCNGVAKVTLKARVPSGGVPARYKFYTGSKVWAGFDVAPGKSVTRHLRIPDGTKVSRTYVFLDKVGGTPISKVVSLGKPFEVICPPWLKVSFAGDCDCNGKAGITLKLAAPGGVRYYKAVVTKNGKTVATKKLGKTGKAEVEVALKHADRVVVNFTAYRTSSYRTSVLRDKSFDMTWN